MCRDSIPTIGSVGYGIENRNPVQVSEGTYLIDFRLPEVQDIIVEQAIAVSKCGLYDGIMFDWWSEGGGTLYSGDPPDFL